MIDAAHHQQRSYNQHVQQRSFQVDDTVWLDSPTAGKLDPKWEGGWKIKAIQGPTTYVIQMAGGTELCTSTEFSHPPHTVKL